MFDYLRVFDGGRSTAGEFPTLFMTGMGHSDWMRPHVMEDYTEDYG
jgi:hypothetical protein